MRKSSKGFGFADERGFTLIEMTVAMAAAAIIMAGIGYSIVQLFNLNTRNTNHMTAVREVQSAGFWLSRDAVQAPADLGATPAWITPQSGSSQSLSLRWRDSDNLTLNHTSVLSWNSSAKSITRTFDNQTAVTIAQNISAATFTVNQGTHNNVSKIVMVVTATVTSRGIASTETRTYEVSPRPGQAQ